MRITIIAIILGLFLAAPLYGGSPGVATDGGSLVLECNKAARKPVSSGDTLYELLGQEVQVYIFNNKSRVFPTRVWSRVPMIRGGAVYAPAWGCRTTPQLEAMIDKYARAYGVDPYLVRAVIRHESGFNAGAVSPKGAQGLMQLMPGTADLMGVRNPFDPEQNIAGGVGYLRLCLDRFQHNVPLAVAAYNAGPESVARYGTIPPYTETQLFVNNVLGTYTGKYPPGQAKGAAPKAPGAAARDAKGAGQAGKTEAAQGKAASETPKPRKRPKIIEVRSAFSAKEPRVSAKVIKGTEQNSNRPLRTD
jgi:hypothetical protein